MADRIISVKSALVLPDLTEWTETESLLSFSNSEIALLTVSVLTAGIHQMMPLLFSRFIIPVE